MDCSKIKRKKIISFFWRHVDPNERKKFIRNSSEINKNNDFINGMLDKTNGNKNSVTQFHPYSVRSSPRREHFMNMIVRMQI